MVSSDKENLTALWMRGISNPMATSTCDGSPSWLEHALPPDAHTPCSSSSSTKAAESIPGTDTFNVPGTRGPSPFTRESGMRARMRCCKASRNDAMRDASSSMCSHAAFAAAAMPTMPATFSVPPRKPFS